MMKEYLMAIVGLLLLGSCSQQPSGKCFTTMSSIKLGDSAGTVNPIGSCVTDPNGMTEIVGTDRTYQRK